MSPIMALFDGISPTYLEADWTRLSVVRGQQQNDDLEPAPPRTTSNASDFVEKSFFSVTDNWDKDAYELTLAALASERDRDSSRLGVSELQSRGHSGPKLDTKRPREVLEVGRQLSMLLLLLLLLLLLHIKGTRRRMPHAIMHAWMAAWIPVDRNGSPCRP